MKLKLRKLDVKSISDRGLLGCFIVLIGRRNSGKTTLMKDLLANMPELDIVIGVSPTDDTNQSMSSCIPKAFIFREANESFLSGIMQAQKKRWASGKGLELCICLDDVAWDRSFFTSKTFSQLCFNGRHMHITVVLCMQYALCIPPPIRAQVDLCVTMSEKMLSNRKKLWEQFFGMMTFNEFCQIMDKTTNGFECLCLWNRSRSNDLDTMLYWYVANYATAESCRTCKDIFWKLSNHYIRDEMNKQEGSVPMGNAIDGVVKASNDGKTIVLGMGNGGDDTNEEEFKLF